ncbi:MAG: zinc ribbon domain-containing protein [Clostridia bacterium]|nr:zinc ribbon domain-containing protein [Clostridia bacterium]
MDKYCEKCGALLAPDALFCFTCGTRIPKADSVDTNTVETEKEIIVESVVENENVSVNEVVFENASDITETTISEDSTINENQPKAEKPKKSVSGIIALILVVAIILDVGGFIGYKSVDYLNDKNSINEAVSNYVDAVYFGEYDKVDDMIPEFFLASEKMKEEFEEFKEENDPKEIADERSENMDKFFGEDIVVTCNVTGFEHLGSDVQVLISDLFFSSYRAFYETDIEFQDIYKVSFDIEVEGSKEEKTYKNSVYAIYFDDGWYLCNLSGNGFMFQDVYEDDTELDDDISGNSNVYNDIIF